MIILNKVLAHSSGEIVLIIILCPAIVCTLVNAISNIIYKNTFKAVILCIISALLIMMLCFSVKPNRIRYELLVTDDSISYDEFTKHWKVIEQDKRGVITAERLDDFPVCDYCHIQYDNDFTIFCPNCGVSIRYHEKEKDKNIYESN